jgi:8-oxo-dGTP pyrophosphatase MutT (NUDIX family)
MKSALRHPIQLSILEDLRVSSGGERYSRMRPDGIENDLYNYHLQQLVRQGLIKKASDKYFLTSLGKELIIELNPINADGDSHRFKIASLCLLIDSSSGIPKLLYQHRTRQPFAGEWGIIGGGWRRGESAVHAARRRLKEESGLEAEFSLFGLMRKRHYDADGHIYSDILFHICASDAYSGELIESNNFGDQSWVPLDEAIAIESNGPIGSTQLAKILAELARKPVYGVPLFYLEETYRQDIY